jgi:hypothetical protein
MTGRWLPHMMLRAASLLVARDQRADWLRGWRSELWYIPRRAATHFCLGAFPDAIWMRRHSQPRGHGIHVESPLACLAWLGLVAAISGAIAILLPAPPEMTRRAHLTLREIPAASAAMLLLTVLALPTVGLVIGCAPARHPPAPWWRWFCRGVFFALKIALVQPMMLCGFVLIVWIGPVVALAPQLAVFASWYLLLRWVLLDQRNRCPVCLRLLTQPVRIGAPSQTFLEWYGFEAMCSLGHGMLQVSATPASYAERAEWHRLDDSWSTLFSKAVEVRQP